MIVNEGVEIETRPLTFREVEILVAEIQGDISVNTQPEQLRNALNQWYRNQWAGYRQNPRVVHGGYTPKGYTPRESLEYLLSDLPVKITPNDRKTRRAQRYQRLSQKLTTATVLFVIMPVTMITSTAFGICIGYSLG